MIGADARARRKNLVKNLISCARLGFWLFKSVFIRDFGIGGMPCRQGLS